MRGGNFSHGFNKEEGDSYYFKWSTYPTNKDGKMGPNPSRERGPSLEAVEKRRIENENFSFGKWL
jgi:hypothetical protein